MVGLGGLNHPMIHGRGTAAAHGMAQNADTNLTSFGIMTFRKLQFTIFIPIYICKYTVVNVRAAYFSPSYDHVAAMLLLDELFFV